MLTSERVRERSQGGDEKKFLGVFPKKLFSYYLDGVENQTLED